MAKAKSAPVTASINRNGSVALHEQIRRSILTDIWKGLYRPGDLLPSEKQLSLQFGVNRLTVRQAVHALANQGHVKPLQGRGYQVRSATLGADVLTVISTSHYLDEYGLEAKSKVVSAGIVPAQREVADSLSIQRGAEVIKIVRQRFAVDVIIAVEEVYYAAEKFGELLDMDLDSHSLVDTLFKVYDLRVGRVSTRLHAEIAGDRAALLGVSPGDALLVATTLTFDLEERPVELGTNFYHSERINFTFNSPVDPASWPYGAQST